MMQENRAGRAGIAMVPGPLLRALTGLMVLMALTVLAALLPRTAHAGDDYLEPEAAFRFSARMLDAHTAEVHYAIASGYHMYRERFAFKASGATLGQPRIPAGVKSFDDALQENVETYHDGVTIRLPVQASGPFTLSVTGQGCADRGLCYPPMTSTAKLDPAEAVGSSAQPPAAGGATSDTGRTGEINESGRIQASLNSGRLLVIVPLFLLFGLGLAFTPCILPMVPILSSIIVGDAGSSTRGRSLLLSAVYSLGMAIVYTIFGIAAGLAGEGLAAALQNPWVLGGFALLMALLSLSMFGVYQLQMPAAIQQRLVQASEKRRAGKLAGVFVMGALSALIVGPCVAAPLAGTLVFISHTRDVLVGGSALFAMAVGMSVPLLLVGASAGALLPRAGKWMDAVKRFFGVLMLATALWMVAPVIPAAAVMLGWAALGIGYAAWLFRGGGRWPAMAFALVLAALGMLELVGVASGGRDALAPLAHLRGQDAAPSLPFAPVHSVAELDAAVARAGKPAMLDFYADWCVSCKEMEKLTFSDPRVRAKMADMVLLRADVTANDDDDKALLKRFGLFGPPGIVFYDSRGRELAGGRVIGYQDADAFLGSLKRVQ